MLERELKFHVPARKRAALKAQLRKLDAEPVELHAQYYDTATQVLARAGIALRLRKEGDAWIQTMKLPGPDELSRLEWNHPREEASLDLSLYADTHVADLLEQLTDRLICRYTTRVLRLKKIVPTASGTAELAYDEGVITSGSLQLPLHEFEIEGISGESADLFALSQEWLNDYELILELRSKAARGNALATLMVEESKTSIHTVGNVAGRGTGKPARPRPLTPAQVLRLASPVKAGQPLLEPRISVGAAYLQCANDCMGQIIRNSSFLAGVDGMKTTHEQRIEYVHQIRVGIRRLRACWKLFSGKVARQPLELEERATHFFRVLGQARDLDVIQTELLPRLIHAGMPPDTSEGAPEAPDESPARARLAASSEYQGMLLDLLTHLVLYGDDLKNHPDLNRLAAPALCKRLNAWLEDIRKNAPGFPDAPWEERHRMRKHIKRLRYGMEFSQGVLNTQRLTPLRSALVSAQKALGQLNDLYVAAEYYRGAGAKHPSAMFALGWLAATQDHEVKASFLALTSLGKAGDFQPATRKSRKYRG